MQNNTPQLIFAEGVEALLEKHEGKSIQVTAVLLMPGNEQYKVTIDCPKTWDKQSLFDTLLKGCLAAMLFPIEITVYNVELILVN